MKWRRFCVLVAVVLVLCTACTVQADSIAPCFVYVNTIRASLSVGGGVAEASGSIFTADVLATKVEVRLQQWYEGEWRTIGHWIGRNNSGPSAAGGSEEVDSGFEYRTYTHGTVYDANGNIIEEVTKYSDSYFY